MVDWPTVYPPTAQPVEASAEVQVRETSWTPAVAVTAGVETKGKYRKPPKRLKLVIVEVLMAIWEMLPVRVKLVEVE